MLEDKVNFQLQFTMSEAALGNTLILSITPAGGDSAGKRTLTFNSTFDSTGSHTIQLTNFSVLAASTTDVVSVSPATDLVNGVTYLFVMSMKDSVDNEEGFSSTAVAVFDTSRIVTFELASSSAAAFFFESLLLLSFSTLPCDGGGADLFKYVSP